ncbi:DoxX family protein [Oceanimonas sp. NS1]|nr:DoxX family protein [Oceanimonas sp. NS1]
MALVFKKKPPQGETHGFISDCLAASSAESGTHGLGVFIYAARRPENTGLSGTGRAPFELFSLSGAAGVLELFGGALLLVGLFTRPVAFVLSGLMAFAYFMVHHPQGFWPLNNGGELAIMFCFVFFYLVFAGGGSWSLDRAKGRR